MEEGIFLWLLKNWRVVLPALLILGMLATIKWQASSIDSLGQEKATLTAKVSSYSAAVDQLQAQAEKNTAASLAAAITVQQLKKTQSRNQELIHAEKNLPGDCAVLPAVMRHNIERLYAGAGSAESPRAKAAAGSALLRAPAGPARGSGRPGTGH